MAFISVAVFFILNKCFSRSKNLKKGYVFCVNVFLFVLAFSISCFYNEQNYPNHYSNYITNNNTQFIVEVSDVPKKTKTLMVIPVDVKVCSGNNKWTAVIGKSIIYYKDTTTNFDIGQQLFVTQKFNAVNEPKNPNEFDYKEFLKRKNIFNVVYCSPQNCIKINSLLRSWSLQKFGNTIKQSVITKLKQEQLSKAAYSISAALLVGYDDDIDSEIIQQFSHSGTLHVLSVSGMHTGVIYGIILFLFTLIDKHNRFKKLKCVVIIGVLWLLAAITGFSPSVMRAALMLTLIIIGQTFYKEGNSINTLCISAFILLLFNPYLIIDVGFLLSHLAVFGILYAYPIINPLFYFENKFLQLMWSSTVMSITATIFTLPVTLYYFHQFPIWFAFSNLVIIPLSMVVLFSSLALIIVSKISWLAMVLTFITNYAAQLMLWFAKLTDNDAYGFIDNIRFSGIDVLFMSLVIVFLFIVIISKSFKSVAGLLSMVVCWCAVNIGVMLLRSSKKEMIVFSIKNKTAIAFANGNTCYVYQDSIPENEFNRYIKPFALMYNNTVLTNYNHLNSLKVSTKEIVVRNNNRINLYEFVNTKPIIIADCSNNYKFVAKLKKECSYLNLPFYSVREKGAYKITR